MAFDKNNLWGMSRDRPDGEIVFVDPPPLGPVPGVWEDVPYGPVPAYTLAHVWIYSRPARCYFRYACPVAHLVRGDPAIAAHIAWRMGAFSNVPGPVDYA